MERNRQTEFPEAPNLMAMLGMFGEVKLGEEEPLTIVDLKITKAFLQKKVILDREYVGDLRVKITDSSFIFTYEGLMPYRMRGKPNEYFGQVILAYNFAQRKRIDRHAEIIFP